MMNYETDEKHCNTKIVVTLEDLRNLWYDQNDTTRIEIIKSIIYTAPNSHSFYQKILKILNSDKFSETLD